MAIYGITGQVLYSTPETVLRSGESNITNILIDCETGYSVYGESVTGEAVEIRHGSSGSFVDVESTPFDLSSWNGLRELFQVRQTAGTITERSRVAFTLTVRRTV